MTRAFVAIRPPEPVLDAIEERLRHVTLPERGRFTPRDQWHVTVQFLGDDVDVDAVAYVLTKVRASPHELSLSGAGTLPRERRSKYLTSFVAGGRDWLLALGEEVAALMTPLGYERDWRDYDPHLTLARFSRREGLQAPCEAFGREPIEPPWTVSELVLYESRLSSGPAEHIARATILLSGNP